MDKEIVVKKSSIEGNGVFANRDFKKGETVIKWDISHELRPEELRRLPEKEKRYVTSIGGKTILMQPPARYVNHSCDANTHAHNFCDVASRDIKKGRRLQQIIQRQWDLMSPWNAIVEAKSVEE